MTCTRKEVIDMYHHYIKGHPQCIQSQYTSFTNRKPESKIYNYDLDVIIQGCHQTKENDFPTEKSW